MFSYPYPSRRIMMVPAYRVCHLISLSFHLNLHIYELLDAIIFPLIIGSVWMAGKKGLFLDFHAFCEHGKWSLLGLARVGMKEELIKGTWQSFLLTCLDLDMNCFWVWVSIGYWVGWRESDGKVGKSRIFIPSQIKLSACWWKLNSIWWWWSEGSISDLGSSID